MTTQPDKLVISQEAEAFAEEWATVLPGNFPMELLAAAFQRAMNQAADERQEMCAKDLWTPPESAWGGLARDLVMWLDMEPRTPRALFKHLERSGREIPQWLRDEPEMQTLDHVPSKGTRAVLIYRAMLSAIRSIGKGGM